MLRAILFSPETPVYEVVEVGNELAAFQAHVGGYIEPLHQAKGKPLMAYVNEEAQLRGFSPNALAYKILSNLGFSLADPPLGPVILLGFDEESGQELSLTDEQVAEIAAL